MRNKHAVREHRRDTYVAESGRTILREMYIGDEEGAIPSLLRFRTLSEPPVIGAHLETIGIYAHTGTRRITLGPMFGGNLKIEDA